MADLVQKQAKPEVSKTEDQTTKPNNDDLAKMAKEISRAVGRAAPKLNGSKSASNSLNVDTDYSQASVDDRASSSEVRGEFFVDGPGGPNTADFKLPSSLSGSTQDVEDVQFSSSRASSSEVRGEFFVDGPGGSDISDFKLPSSLRGSTQDVESVKSSSNRASSSEVRGEFFVDGPGGRDTSDFKLSSELHDASKEK